MRKPDAVQETKEEEATPLPNFEIRDAGLEDDKGEDDASEVILDDEDYPEDEVK